MCRNRHRPPDHTLTTNSRSEALAGDVCWTISFAHVRWKICAHFLSLTAASGAWRLSGQSCGPCTGHHRTHLHTNPHTHTEKTLKKKKKTDSNKCPWFIMDLHVLQPWHEQVSVLCPIRPTSKGSWILFHREITWEYGLWTHFPVFIGKAQLQLAEEGHEDNTI